jgi:hypothetical protein
VQRAQFARADAFSLWSFCNPCLLRSLRRSIRGRRGCLPSRARQCGATLELLPVRSGVAFFSPSCPALAIMQAQRRSLRQQASAWRSPHPVAPSFSPLGTHLLGAHLQTQTTSPEFSKFRTLAAAPEKYIVGSLRRRPNSRSHAGIHSSQASKRGSSSLRSGMQSKSAGAAWFC